MKRLTAKREEGGVAKETIPSHVVKFPIVGLERENEEVHLQKTQVLPKPPESQMPLKSQESLGLKCPYASSTFC